MIGLNVFKEYFKDYSEQYILIGGADCRGAYSGFWAQVLAVYTGRGICAPGQEQRGAAVL